MNSLSFLPLALILTPRVGDGRCERFTELRPEERPWRNEHSRGHGDKGPDALDALPDVLDGMP